MLAWRRYSATSLPYPAKSSPVESVRPGTRSTSRAACGLASAQRNATQHTERTPNRWIGRDGVSFRSWWQTASHRCGTHSSPPCRAVSRSARARIVCRAVLCTLRSQSVRCVLRSWMPYRAIRERGTSSAVRSRRATPSKRDWSDARRVVPRIAVGGASVSALHYATLRHHYRTPHCVERNGMESKRTKLHPSLFVAATAPHRTEPKMDLIDSFIHLFIHG